MAITDLMYGNKGVLKEQLWSQETGASDHRNGSASLRLFGSFCLIQDAVGRDGRSGAKADFQSWQLD